MFLLYVMKQDLLQTIKIIITAVVFSVSVSYLSAWTAPLGAPTGGDSILTVLNTGTTNQVKSGGLGVGAFTADSALFNGDISAGNFIVGSTIKVGDTGDTCDAASAGRIRYTGTDFVGCNGYSWESLTND